MAKIWTNGCFDILHIGHLKMLEYAKSKGDYLVVGIDTDQRVKKLKGNERPYNNQEDRRNFLLGIKWVDEVVFFDSEESLEKHLLEFKIELIVVGEEYKNGIVLGSTQTKVEFFPRFGNYSTSEILSSKNI